MKTYYKAIVIVTMTKEIKRSMKQKSATQRQKGVYKKMICNKGGTTNKRMNYLVKCYKN